MTGHYSGEFTDGFVLRTKYLRRQQRQTNQHQDTNSIGLIVFGDTESPLKSRPVQLRNTIGGTIFPDREFACFLFCFFVGLFVWTWPSRKEPYRSFCEKGRSGATVLQIFRGGHPSSSKYPSFFVSLFRSLGLFHRDFNMVGKKSDL